MWLFSVCAGCMQGLLLLVFAPCAKLEHTRLDQAIHVPNVSNCLYSLFLGFCSSQWIVIWLWFTKVQIKCHQTCTNAMLCKLIAILHFKIYILLVVFLSWWSWRLWWIWWCLWRCPIVAIHNNEFITDRNNKSSYCGWIEKWGKLLILSNTAQCHTPHK